MAGKSSLGSCISESVFIEEGMAPHSSVLAWRIPWTEEPGGLQSIGLQRVGHDWSNLAHTRASLPQFYPEFDWLSLFGCIILGWKCFSFRILKKNFFFDALCGMWDLSFPTRNQTHAPCLGSMEPQPLGHQGGPPSEFWGHWPVVFWQPGSLLRRPVSSFPIFCRSLKGLLFVSVLSIHDGDWQESCFPPLCWALAWSASSLGKPLFFQFWETFLYYFFNPTPLPFSLCSFLVLWLVRCWTLHFIL